MNISLDELKALGGIYIENILDGFSDYSYKELFLKKGELYEVIYELSGCR